MNHKKLIYAILIIFFDQKENFYFQQQEEEEEEDNKIENKSDLKKHENHLNQIQDDQTLFVFIILKTKQTINNFKYYNNLIESGKLNTFNYMLKENNIFTDKIHLNKYPLNKTVLNKYDFTNVLNLEPKYVDLINLQRDQFYLLGKKWYGTTTVPTNIISMMLNHIKLLKRWIIVMSI